MDKQFLEFWGNLLLQAAKGQARMENVNKWLAKGFSDVGGFTDLFRRIYNLDTVEKPGTELPEGFEQAAERFNQAYRDYLALLDVVPGSRFRECETKIEGLQKEVLRLQQEIDRLRAKPPVSSAQTEAIVADFQALLQKQQRAFQNLTQQFSHAFEPRPSGQGEKTPVKKA